MDSLLEPAQAEMGYPVSIGGLEQACRSAPVSTLLREAPVLQTILVTYAVERSSSVV